MRGQVTIPTILVMMIFAIQLGFLAPVFYGSINENWDDLEPVERLAAAMIVPTAFLAILMVPFNRNRLANIIGAFAKRQRPGKKPAAGSSFAAVGGFGKF